MKTILTLFLLSISVLNAQNLKIFGVVKDASTGENLPFASVSLEDGTKGDNTDIDGKYTLSLTPGNYKILASYIGYKTEIVPVEIKNNDAEINFNLTATGVLLQEVSVYASSDKEQTVSSISMQSKEIEKISSIFPDVFRSIQALPGIAVNNEFSAKFNVRGGNFDENLVLVNGTQVYEPFHIKEAENASVGIFNIDLMKKVNLINGGFSAQYGDRLSSVLNIEYRDGNREEHSGSATLSLTNLDAFVEGPLTSKSSYILGVRKSYMEYILSLVDVEDNVSPSFYDIQGVLTYNFSDINKLRFKFIHAGDDYTTDPDTDTYGPINEKRNEDGQVYDVYEYEIHYNEENAKYYSNLFDVQNTIFLAGNAFLNTSISYYHQMDKEYEFNTDEYTFEASGIRSFFYRAKYRSDYDKKLTIKTLEAKSSLDLRFNPFYDLKTGFSYLRVSYDENLIDRNIRSISQNLETYPDTLNQNYNENYNYFPQNINAVSFKLAGFVENIFQLSNNLIINGGARVDYFDFNRDLTFSPRVSASYKFDNGINLRVAWGYYFQSPVYRQLAYSVASDTNTQSQKAEHFILGAEQNFKINGNPGDNFTLKIEGYYKKYSDLISSERRNDGNIDYSRKNDAEGYAAGIDLYASIKAGIYYGWISYGLLYAKEDILTDSSGDFPRFTDQRHTISFVNDFNLGKEWNLNLRFTFGSGFAYTPFHSIYDSKERRYQWVEGGKNSDHLPVYKRADLRLSKGFSLFGFPASAFLDISNLFNSANIYSFRYRFDNNGRPFRQEVKLWPRLPTLGLTINF